MVILENIDINIDIDNTILQNIDIDKILNRFKFGISNRARSNRGQFCAIRVGLSVDEWSCQVVEYNELYVFFLQKIVGG